jgi:hypothetical protein
LAADASKLSTALNLSSQNWHRLFEVCGFLGTLLADEGGVYDANDPNGRLLLG